MGLTKNVLVSLSLLAVGLGMVGCAGLTNVERKMHMAAAHLESNPVYEGRLTSAKRVGPMTALEFSDGKLFDVQSAPETLIAGDIIRLFKTDKGLEAYLWRASAERGS